MVKAIKVCAQEKVLRRRKRRILRYKEPGPLALSQHLHRAHLIKFLTQEQTPHILGTIRILRRRMQILFAHAHQTHLRRLPARNIGGRRPGVDQRSHQNIFCLYRRGNPLRARTRAMHQRLPPQIVQAHLIRRIAKVKPRQLLGMTLPSQQPIGMLCFQRQCFFHLGYRVNALHPTFERPIFHSISAKHVDDDGYPFRLSSPFGQM
ncbi:hypothetical protein SDC9_177270 [bioreactor metagenome]|uniref:Uncharacterized protein n=1 Tax=bioreactor metagenome TaxID=1076179 RepID=A0A645GSD1_9ZZZZ